MVNEINKNPFRFKLLLFKNASFFMMGERVLKLSKLVRKHAGNREDCSIGGV